MASRGPKGHLRSRAQLSQLKGEFLLALQEVAPKAFDGLVNAPSPAKHAGDWPALDAWGDEWRVDITSPGLHWLRVWAYSRRKGRTTADVIEADSLRWRRVVEPDLSRARLRGSINLTRIQRPNAKRDARWFVRRHFLGHKWTDITSEYAEPPDERTVAQAVAATAELLGFTTSPKRPKS